MTNLATLTLRSIEGILPTYNLISIAQIRQQFNETWFRLQKISYAVKCVNTYFGVLTTSSICGKRTVFFTCAHSPVLARVEAARRYKAITGDYAGFDALLEQIEDFSGRESLRCALMQPDTTPIAEAAARSLGLRRFLQVVFFEGLERLRPTRLPEADAASSASEYAPLETK